MPSPAAEFGLPIVFHFQGRGEPPNTTLQPVVAGEIKERMASPLILKPLALADGQAVPIIVPLLTPACREVELMQGQTESWAVEEPTPSAIRGWPLSWLALAGLSHQGSALEAFLNSPAVPLRRTDLDSMEITQ